MNKGQVIGWSIVVVIALGVAGFFGVRAHQRAQAVKPFKEHVDTYIKLDKGQFPGGPGGLGGKIGNTLVTVDVGEREIDYAYFDLPEDRRATKPEEVDSVVLLKWGKKIKGWYAKEGSNDTSKPGYWQTCDVTVVDRQSGEAQAQSSFQGSDPPEKSSSSATGNKPTDKIVTWLAGLQRK
jgi:hypothetical protein